MFKNEWILSAMIHNVQLNMILRVQFPIERIISSCPCTIWIMLSMPPCPIRIMLAMTPCPIGIMLPCLHVQLESCWPWLHVQLESCWNDSMSNLADTVCMLGINVRDGSWHESRSQSCFRCGATCFTQPDYNN